MTLKVQVCGRKALKALLKLVATQPAWWSGHAVRLPAGLIMLRNVELQCLVHDPSTNVFTLLIADAAAKPQVVLCAHDKVVVGVIAASFADGQDVVNLMELECLWRQAHDVQDLGLFNIWGQQNFPHSACVYVTSPLISLANQLWIVAKPPAVCTTEHSDMEVCRSETNTNGTAAAVNFKIYVI